MVQKVSDSAVAGTDLTKQMLRELGFPIYRLGYKELCIAIPRFALDKGQLLSTELYPYAAKQFGISDWRAVENAIRRAIQKAWRERDPQVWAQYFPNQKEAPTNLHFIATLAEYLEE